MSGTSLDGLDISFLKTDGYNVIKPIFNTTYNYSNLIKLLLKYSIKTFEKELQKNSLNIQKNIIFLESIFSYFCFRKLMKFFNKFSLSKGDIDLIGFHGQTLYHNANKKISFQLGDANYLSKKLNIAVITKFRQADLDNGGQGAPLVPLYHQKLFSKRNKNIAVINIGGISNLTFLVKNSKVFSTDIGPGNKLIDEFCMKVLGKKYDFNGMYSAKGKENIKIVEGWKEKNIFKKKIPRSFNNNDFILDEYMNKYLSDPYDFLASLVCFTASLINESINFFDNSPSYIVVCGGGALNKTLIKKLKSLIKRPLFISNKFGFPLEFIESQAFGYYAVRKALNLPVTFSSTTGAKIPTVCGEINYPKYPF